MDREYRKSDGDIRRTESRIDPGDELHIIGQKVPVTEANDGFEDASAFIGDGDAAATFRITEGSELETVVRMVGRSLVAMMFAVALPVGSGAWLTANVPELAEVIGIG